MAKGGDCVVKHAGVFVTGMGMVVREWEWWYGSGDSGDCVVKHAGVFVKGMGIVIWVPPISYKTLSVPVPLIGIMYLLSVIKHSVYSIPL